MRLGRDVECRPDDLREPLLRAVVYVPVALLGIGGIAAEERLR
jgi:hypothetical protein